MSLYLEKQLRKSALQHKLKYWLAFILPTPGFRVEHECERPGSILGLESPCEGLFLPVCDHHGEE